MNTKRRNNDSMLGIIDINDIKKQQQMKEEEETQAAELPYISEAIWEDIFTRIPAETLYKLRYVCKPWHKIITSPIAAFCHQNFPCSEPPGLLITSLVQDGAIIDGEIRFSYQTYFIKVTERSYEEQDMSKWFKEYVIHACCNGLLLLSDRSYYNRYYYVANPLTKKLVMLPPCGRLCEKPELVFCPSTGEYKVVMFGPMIKGMVPIIDTSKVEQDFNIWPCDQFKAKGYEILTLGGCSDQEQLQWRRVEGPSITKDYSTIPPVTVNGVLHMFDFPGRIVSFDVSTEVFHENPFPMFDWRRLESRFVDMGGFLSFVHLSFLKNRLEIWILKDFQTGEWTKQHSINMWMGGIRSLRNERVVPIMSIGENGDIIIFGKQQGGYEGGRLRAYSVKLNRWWEVGSKKFSTFTSDFGCHVNKLVSLKTLVQRN